MYTNLLLYRNELKIKSMPKYKLIGITTQLLFSKKVFSRNSEITDFLKNVFDIEFKDYVMKSRTLIVAKICRKIENLDNYSLEQKKLYKFVCSIIDNWKNDDIKKKKNDFDGWID